MRAIRNRGVSDEAPQRPFWLFTLPLGMGFARIFGSSCNHQLGRWTLFLQQQSENIFGPKGRRKCHCTRNGRCLCDNLRAVSFAIWARCAGAGDLSGALDRGLEQKTWLRKSFYTAMGRAPGPPNWNAPGRCRHGQGYRPVCRNVGHQARLAAHNRAQ